LVSRQRRGTSTVSACEPLPSHGDILKTGSAAAEDLANRSGPRVAANDAHDDHASAQPRTDPAHEVGIDGRAALQSRLTLYAFVNLLFCVSYWPAFYLIWSRDPRFGPQIALEHVTAPSAWGLALVYTVFGLFFLSRPWPVSVLAIVDVAFNTAIGVMYAAIVLHHPSPLVAVLEGELALMSVLSIRALLVPSSARRTALAGVCMCASPSVMLLAHEAHFSSATLAYSTLVFISVTWSSIVVVFSSVASSVLYGLRRAVEDAKRFGQYTLLEKLGEGGMGVVYRARHAMLRRPTAIKLLNLSHSGTSLSRFEREVQSMAELTHPNTVTVHDYGCTADGIFYYAMEYLEGVDLQFLVEVDGPQSAARVIHILRQACGALAEAHARALIHRDVKPGNIFLCRERGTPDMVKILDFGVVKDMTQSPDVRATGDQSVIGTPLYLSPESISNPNSMDLRSDLYSLGAVGYFLLCGQPVFGAQTFLETCAHHLHSVPERPSLRLARPVPTDLETILLRCLEKRPDARPSSAEELAAALSLCAGADEWTTLRARSWWSDNHASIDARRAERARNGASWSERSEKTIAVHRMKHVG
jgi:serine/threonine protein kinase